MARYHQSGAVQHRVAALRTTRRSGARIPASGIGPGSVLDARYRLDAMVGRGGTATVYRGTDELLGRSVAVKMFNPHLTDPVMVTRQYQEMRVVAGLQHPHLVAVYDARMRDARTSRQATGPGTWSWNSWTGRASRNGSTRTR